MFSLIFIQGVRQWMVILWYLFVYFVFYFFAVIFVVVVVATCIVEEFIRFGHKWRSEGTWTSMTKQWLSIGRIVRMTRQVIAASPCWINISKDFQIYFILRTYSCIYNSSAQCPTKACGIAQHDVNIRAMTGNKNIYLLSHSKEFDHRQVTFDATSAAHTNQMNCIYIYITLRYTKILCLIESIIDIIHRRNLFRLICHIHAHSHFLFFICRWWWCDHIWGYAGWCW